MESLNTQSLAVVHREQSLPLITVQIVEEQIQSALDAVFQSLDGGTRAGRMGEIVPRSLANLKAGPKGAPVEDLRNQLKEFARTKAGADCLKYFGYKLDIHESCTLPKEEVQTAISFDAMFQAGECHPRAGRMGSVVPLSAAELNSQPPRPLREDLRKQLEDFASTRRGANCLKYFGYCFDNRESKAYPVSVKLEKALPFIAGEKPEPGNAIFEAQIAAPSATSIKTSPSPEVTASFATEELKAVAKVAQPDPQDILLRQKIRKAIEKSQPKSNVASIREKKEKRQAVRTSKENAQLLAIKWVASICLLVSCVAQMQHVVQSQSLQRTAEQKLNAGDLPGAKIAFERVIQTQPGNWEAYLGHAASIPGEYAKQIDDYNHVLALKTGEPRAALGLARAYYELADYDSAIAFANRSYAQTSNNESLKIKAMSLMNLRNYVDASKTFQQVLAKSTKQDAEIFYRLASCQQALGHRDQQVKYLRKASAVEPKNTNYLNQLATLFVAENKFEDAKLALQKAISVNSKESELHVRLAKVLAQLNAPNKAVNELSQAIDHGRGPKADLLKQRASLYCSMNNYGRALADVDNAIVLKPSDKALPKMRERIVYQLAVIKAGLDRQLGRQLAQSNRAANSSKVAAAQPSAASPGSPPASSATVLDGAHSQQMVLKAYKHIKSGDFKSAIPVLQTAVKKDPENSQAHRYLAFSYLNSGMVSKALAHSKQVVALGTEHPHDLYSLGEAHFYDGKPQEAMKYYRDALRINPLHVEARLGAIRSLIAMGKVEEAKSVCEAAAYSSRSEKAKFQFRRMLNDIKSKNQIAAARSFKS